MSDFTELMKTRRSVRKYEEKEVSKEIVDKLLENGSVQRAYLGVKLDPDFNEETAKRLELDRLRGARVTEVYPNTPASRVNLKFDDVILSFDGIDVQDENHLINLVSLTEVDKKVRLSIQRSGRRLTVATDWTPGMR